MSGVLQTWWFLVAIGPLIIFHELGHYAVARLCGVKVLRFSLGFGKVLWSRRLGRDRTEWAVSMIPLGGYVKMLDNRDPATAATDPADAAREFTHQSAARRMAIIAAGPLANFILAIGLFAAMFMVGVPDASTHLRHMPESTAAYKAGLRAGDRVVAVNGEPVAAWEELRMEVMKSAFDAEQVRLEVAQPRGGRFAATLPADSFAGVKLESDIMSALGLAPQLSPAVIGEVMEGGAARRAGLKAGDVVTAAGGKAVHDGIDFIAAVRASGGRPLELTVVRGGAEVALTVTPDADPQSRQGVIKAEVRSKPEMVTVPGNLPAALARGARTTWDGTVLQVKMIGKLISGQVSLSNITGPLTIADFADKTAKAGLIPFLRFIALVSISLGVMNLLPIPVLDGGHLLYYSLEVLIRRPLPERFVEVAQRVGVIMLVMLMSLALFNDIVRRL